MSNEQKTEASRTILQLTKEAANRAKERREHELTSDELEEIQGGIGIAQNPVLTGFQAPNRPGSGGGITL